MVAKWSFGKSRRDSGSFDSEATPGPGAYDSHIVRDPVRLSKFGKDRRAQRPNSAYYNPGPGTYQQNSRKEAPAWKIAHRPSTPKSERSPGPQTYSPVKASHRAPRCLIQGKYDTRASLKFSPGPATYSPNKVTNTSPSRSFDKAEKGASFIMDFDTPGPGEYVVNLKGFRSSPRAMFGKSLKKGMEERNPEMPGPGSYNISRETSKKGFTITPRRERPKSAHIITPGPGSYSSAVKFFSTSHQIGRMKRITVDTKNGPSCCDYTPKVVTESSPKFTMGMKYSMTERNSKRSPGPGEYNFSGIIGSGPSHTMRGRNFSQSFDFTPGPGTYRNEDVRATKKKSSAAIFGTESRKNIVRKDSKTTPGPLDYSHQSQGNQSPKFSFGKSKRMAFGSFGLSPKRYKPRVGSANDTHSGRVGGSGTMLKTCQNAAESPAQMHTRTTRAHTHTKHGQHDEKGRVQAGRSLGR